MARVMGSVLSPVLGGFSSLLAPLRPTPGPPALPIAGVHHSPFHYLQRACQCVTTTTARYRGMPMNAILDGGVALFSEHGQQACELGRRKHVIMCCSCQHAMARVASLCPKT